MVSVPLFAIPPPTLAVFAARRIRDDVDITQVQLACVVDAAAKLATAPLALLERTSVVERMFWSA
jgi:hypothetical protein